METEIKAVLVWPNQSGPMMPKNLSTLFNMPQSGWKIRLQTTEIAMVDVTVGKKYSARKKPRHRTFCSARATAIPHTSPAGMVYIA